MDFLGGPVVKTPHFQSKGVGSIPGQGTGSTPGQGTKMLHDPYCGQKKRKLKHREG